MRDARFLFGAVIALTVALLATITLLAVVSLDALGSAARAADSATSAARHASAATALLAAQQARLHTQLVEGCERLNIQRATANASNATEYAIDSIFSSAVRAQRPPRHESAQQRRLTPRFLAAEQTALQALTWTPLTDCASAVAIAGSAYRAPAPISFATRPPPPAALNAANAAKSVPAGSVP